MEYICAYECMGRWSVRSICRPMCMSVCQGAGGVLVEYVCVRVSEYV